MTQIDMATTIGDLTDPLRELVHGFLQAHPESRACDVYRLLHDGTCTGETTPERDAVLQQLTDLASDARDAGDIIETASVDGSLVRVNVGPYVGQGGDLARLAEAVVQTAETNRPRRDILFTLWAGFVHMNRRHEFRMDKDDVAHFEMTVATAGYPPVDHSQDYVREYDPRYVVVLREFVPAAGDASTAAG